MVKVLDKGFIDVVDVMGSDLSVVNAARVSFGKRKDEMTPGDSKLIRYLWTHMHTSPFRHASIQFHLKAPIFVLRQWMKHQVGCAWNEISGRYVVFESMATNLVATPDSNGLRDVYVHDRQTGQTRRVSTTAAAVDADGASTDASISADGAVIAFKSEAKNLISNDLNGVADVFVEDAAAGGIVRRAQSLQLGRLPVDLEARAHRPEFAAALARDASCVPREVGEDGWDTFFVQTGLP